MSESGDKRRRSDLDLFVLALIESGVSTPYELHKMAGLSPGASIPVLGRLVETGLIRQLKAGVRRRVGHKTTAGGRKHLESGWRALVDAGPSGDTDADLRVALLAQWVGGDRRWAVEFLRAAAAKKLELMRAAEETPDEASSSALAVCYRQMRANRARVLLKGEYAAASALADALPRNLSRRRSKGAAK